MSQMIVIKIGGSIVDGLHETTAQDLSKIASKEKIIIVHGGGKEVTSVAEKLGKEQRFVVSPGGIRSRYTDKETAEIYTMVMAGKINKQIVSLLHRSGINAVGLAGIDGAMIRAERKKKLVIVDDRGRKIAIDGGYTGKISSVDATLLDILTSNGYVPVVSPVAMSEEFDLLNVDGDRAAAYVAGSVKADKVIFMTNVAGLLMDDKLVTKLTASEARKMLPKIGFGMEKKILACTEAVGMGVKEAIVASGQVANPVSSALKHDNCTVISGE